MSLLDQIANELTASDAPAAKPAKSRTAKAAAKPAKSAAPTARGFVEVKPSSANIANAKRLMTAYLTSDKYPSVGFNPADKSKQQNFACMLAVGFGPTSNPLSGWTNDADGTAKVALIQRAYGIQPIQRKLGFPAMASASAIVRQKTMRTIGAHWIGRPDSKGVFRLVPTKPQERVALLAIVGQGKRTGDKPAAKGKAAKSAKVVSPKARADRSNGPVTVTVDKALRSTARAAERNAQRAANRAKVAAESKSN